MKSRNIYSSSFLYMENEKRQKELTRIRGKKKRKQCLKHKRKLKYHFESTHTIPSYNTRTSLTNRDCQFWKALHKQTCENVYQRKIPHLCRSFSTVSYSQTTNPLISYASVLMHEKIHLLDRNSSTRKEYYTFSENQQTDMTSDCANIMHTPESVCNIANNECGQCAEQTEMMSVDLESEPCDDLDDFTHQYDIYPEIVDIYTDDYEMITRNALG